jgi:hypothetical protein
MKKILLAALILCNVAAFAQRTTKGSIGFEAGLPVGQADEVYSSVLGGTFKAEFPSSGSKALNYTLTVGYQSFMVKSEYSIIKNATYIPIKGGLKYFTSNNFYLEGELGASINTNRYYGYTGSKTAFLYAPGIGVNFPLAGGNAFDLGLRYESRLEDGGALSQFALRLAYKFNL